MSTRFSHSSIRIFFFCARFSHWQYSAKSPFLHFNRAVRRGVQGGVAAARGGVNASGSEDDKEDDKWIPAAVVHEGDDHHVSDDAPQYRAAIRDCQWGYVCLSSPLPLPPLCPYLWLCIVNTHLPIQKNFPKILCIRMTFIKRKNQKKEPTDS